MCPGQGHTHFHLNMRYNAVERGLSVILHILKNLHIGKMWKNAEKYTQSVDKKINFCLPLPKIRGDMASIVLGLSTKIDNMGMSEVMLRFTGGRGLQFRIKSGVIVPARLFDTKKGCVNIPRMASVEQRVALKAKKMLDEIVTLMLEEFMARGKGLTAQHLRDVVERYHHPNRDKAWDGTMPFASLIPEYVKVQKLSEWRRKAFDVVWRMFRRYELWSGKTIPLDGLTEKVLREFEDFITNEYKYINISAYADVYESVDKSRIPTKRGRNTIIGVMTKIRSVVLWANRQGWTSLNAFVRYKLPEAVYGKPYYITIEERNAICEADLSGFPHLEVQRDIFIFQCLIGCRVGDLMRFTKDNLVNGAIEYVPRKTKEGRPVAVRVPLNATAREIVERYADVEGDALLPFVVEQYYNRAIKEIFTKAGITRKVTIINPTTGEEERRPINEIASSHLARRTFIGNLYKKVKDPNLIGALSGHKEGSKAFARYRDIDEDMRKELVDMLE